LTVCKVFLGFCVYNKFNQSDGEILMNKKFYFLLIFAVSILSMSMADAWNHPAGGAQDQPPVKGISDQAVPETPDSKMSEPFTGKVVETIKTEEYTYVQVDTGEKKVWIAARTFTGKPGDSVNVPPGLPMPGFHSKTLSRDFEMIYFVGSVGPEGECPASNGENQLPSGHPPISGMGDMKGMGDMQGMHPPMGDMSNKVPVEVGKVKPAKGGKTVSEIITGKQNLTGQKVVLRAKVVKFSPEILGTNWLHVQDGSGNEGSNDLIVTTKATVKVGDTVLIRGSVSLDRDFGYGLKYPVIIENAEVSVE
jgi:hypothetical protein